ncbi:hypothetical protein ABZ714_23820 [Streptomyces sp. NPDC006798]|uniref:hypothetical protein n=1 Tax=Streptomyces sp. NPDC006798 TaxID=3155462 RepID=UPI0033F15943
MKKRLLGTLLSAAFLGSIATAAPATAAPAGPDDNFHVCYFNSDCLLGYTSGLIKWNWGIPNITGKVYSEPGSGSSTTAVFEAFDGSKMIASDSRTVASGNKDLAMLLGNANVDRVKITVCKNFAAGTLCGRPENYSRA